MQKYHLGLLGYCLTHSLPSKQHPFFSHSLPEINTTPHPRHLTLSLTPLWRYCTELVLPWLPAHGSSALPKAQLHLCAARALYLESQHVCHHLSFHLLPPPKEVPGQVRRDSRVKFLTFNVREQGSQGTEKKKQQQSKALTSPVPTQV